MRQLAKLTILGLGLACLMITIAQPSKAIGAGLSVNKQIGQKIATNRVSGLYAAHTIFRDTIDADALVIEKAATNVARVINSPVHFSILPKIADLRKDIITDATVSGSKLTVSGDIHPVDEVAFSDIAESNADITTHVNVMPVVYAIGVKTNQISMRIDDLAEIRTLTVIPGRGNETGTLIPKIPVIDSLAIASHIDGIAIDSTIAIINRIEQSNIAAIRNVPPVPGVSSVYISASSISGRGGMAGISQISATHPELALLATSITRSRVERQA